MTEKEIRKHRRRVYVLVENEPDTLGRQHFWLQWLTNNIGRQCNETGLRGQYFFAVLSEHLPKWKERGYKIIYVKELQ